jgi:hypothetical protein
VWISLLISSAAGTSLRVVEFNESTVYAQAVNQLFMEEANTAKPPRQN